LCSFSPSPSTNLPLPSSSYPWLPMMVASSWLIFFLKWYLQSSLFLLHYDVIHFQEVKDSIDEEDPRPTSSIWSYIKIDSSYDDFLLPFLCPKYIQLFNPMSKFVPLVYGHQALPLTKDHIYNIGMIMMQCGLTN